MSPETTRIPRPPRGREEAPVQISRLLEAHEILIKDIRDAADEAEESGDSGTNDLLVSSLLRTHELQGLVYFRTPGGRPLNPGGQFLIRS